MEQSRAISIVIPAFNEETGIAEVVRSIHEYLKDIEYEIIVVNDGSTDGTAVAAEAAGAQVVNHRTNKGYGASVKSGIRRAGYDWIVILDGDGQHDAIDIQRLLDKKEEGFDAVIGSRDPSSFQYASRKWGKTLLRRLAEYLLGPCPDDLNSGLRIFRKQDAIHYFPILPNGFSLSTTLTLAMLKDAFELGTIPIQAHPRQGRRSTVKMKDGFQTFLLILRVAALFNPLKVFVPISLFLFSLGGLYGVVNLWREFNIPDGAVLLMLTGVVVFFFGILSDQLSSMRRGG
ncbi:MAG: glycosyltransferase family 2 protein [Candidatus Omnitrophota bacterium]|jgi:glycosyltransferase involved in cell wall biosynthesis|nr:MAG: glycosyltransferase family 2 protein [Candidatus Omnitrophota bacterium]